MAKKKRKHDPNYYKKPERSGAVLKKVVEIATFITMRGPMSKTEIRKRLGGGSSIFSEAFKLMEKHNKGKTVEGKFQLTDNVNYLKLHKSIGKIIFEIKPDSAMETL